MSTSLELFEKLVSPASNKRVNRSTELLRDPVGECEDAWRLYLPRAFDAALDIAQTERVVKRNGRKTKVLEWTQGSAFSFEAGDVLYDTRDAYLRWGDAVPHIGCCVEVISAASSAPQQKGVPRFPGAISIKVSRIVAVGQKPVEVGRAETTQDEFVRFVLGGVSTKLESLFGTIV